MNFIRRFLHNKEEHMFMRKILITTFVAFVSLSAFAQEHWSYSFPTGPNQWTGTCATGSSQSPVGIENGDVADFKNTVYDSTLPDLKLAWSPTNGVPYN